MPDDKTRFKLKCKRALGINAQELKISYKCISTVHMKGKLSVELSWEVFRGCAKADII